jgi:hypothetical protein
VKTSTLGLEWRTRPAGGGCTERRYLDFVVDGASMHDRLKQTDHVTPLGCWSADAELQSIRQLLAGGAAESPGGRVPLYVCGECGDLECGAVTALVERTANGFVWRNFKFGNGRDDSDWYPGVGPFLFDATAYAQVLNGRAAALGAPPQRP